MDDSRVKQIVRQVADEFGAPAPTAFNIVPGDDQEKLAAALELVAFDILRQYTQEPSFPAIEDFAREQAAKYLTDEQDRQKPRRPPLPD